MSFSQSGLGCLLTLHLVHAFVLLIFCKLVSGPRSLIWDCGWYCFLLMKPMMSVSFCDPLLLNVLIHQLTGCCKMVIFHHFFFIYLLGYFSKEVLTLNNYSFIWCCWIRGKRINAWFFSFTCHFQRNELITWIIEGTIECDQLILFFKI